ncbi:hypothetical protein L210DRAFT_864066 [Boletus edulis BED1]|uniref:Uncharacterized protein n=1 Tax=Boletus edulis BED1 TaxID=1328754 RepID=A0AAD4C791_BOLED|nr:hypothetical protein L210DRAFT_864066 [Boletus edulis BED1]
MPQEWTTEDQKSFLKEELVVFKRIEWPMVLPGVPDSAVLMPDQIKTLADAIKLRQDQLRRWMHWHSSAGDKRSANAKTAKIMKGLLQPKTRSRKPWEVYSKLYYTTRIQPHIEKGMSISEVNETIKEIFADETPEVKAEVQILCDEDQKEKKKHKTSETQSENAKSDAGEAMEIDPMTLRSNIQQCGPALQWVLEHFSWETRWSFSVLMGGLDPVDPEGGNMITSLHVGKTRDGHDFSEVYPNFDAQVVEAYGEFLSRTCSE